MNHEERLHRRRELYRQRRDRETDDERQEWLRRQRDYMRRRRATLTDQQRETILQQRRNLIRQPRRDGYHSENASITEDPAEEGQHSCQQTRRLPRFDDPEVIAKMTQFHDELAGTNTVMFYLFGAISKHVN